MAPPTFFFFCCEKKIDERATWERERKKKNKKIICTWTVTVHICTVTVYLQNSFLYLHIYTNIDVGVFWVKMCKVEHFLYFANFCNHISIKKYNNNKHIKTKSNKHTLLAKGYHIQIFLSNYSVLRVCLDIICCWKLKIENTVAK